MVVSIT